VLPDHLMRELRYLEVYTARQIRNLRSGTFTSRMRGDGFDFDEHRPYRYGDDVRRIDWNVTARLQEPFVRQTHAERELNLLIALDLSASMQFGTARYSKRDVMIVIAGCLVFSALADQINTGFLTFTDRVISYHRPRRRRARAWATLEELWHLDPPATKSAVLPVAQYLNGHLRRNSIIVVVSDFLTGEDFGASRELKALAARHDIIAVVVEDPAEAALPPGSSTVRVRDLETRATRTIGLSDSLRRRYAAAVDAQRDDVITAFYRVPMEHVVVRADGNITEPLMKLFASRRRT
jgi:uncharacterized protein (DUF58 family)